MFAQAEHRSDRVSYEDFLANADGVRAEWVDGEILYMSPQTDRHLLIMRFLSAVLDGYVDRKEIGGLVGPAGFQVRLGRSGREPDVFYLAPEHMDRFRPTFVQGAVDLAVEILSPESRVRDRREKFREYAEAGVREYWIIDPEAETMEPYRLSDAGAYEPAPLDEAGRVMSEVIPGLWIDPAWMWVERPSQWTAYREWGLI
jgi:Uma2 family endonuclease